LEFRDPPDGLRDQERGAVLGVVVPATPAHQLVPTQLRLLTRLVHQEELGQLR
jgi:hypothetical protein